MPLCEVGYRIIGRNDYFTPLMYLPIQRTRIEVGEPCGEEQVRDALIKDFGADWFESRDTIRDIECWRV